MVRKLVIMGVAAAALCGPAMAETKSSNHTLTWGGDIWRIELRNIEKFRIVSSGDSDGVSELYTVNVSLRSQGDQYHTFEEKNPYFRLNNSGIVGDWANRSRDNKLNVRVGQYLFLDNIWRDITPPPPRGYVHPYNLWVHSRQIDQGDLGPPELKFDLVVTTRELDCVRDRVCGRGNTGVATYTVSLPIPAQRDFACNNNNTYRISGGYRLRIQPMSAGRETRYATARYTGSKQGPSLRAAGVADAIYMSIEGADICLASSTRS